MPFDKESSLSQDSHPLEAALFQYLDAKARLGETEERPVPLPQYGTALKGPAPELPVGSVEMLDRITFSLCPIPHPPQCCSSNKLPSFKSSCQSLFLENLTQDRKRRPHSAAHLPKAMDVPQVSGFSQRIVSRSPTDHRGWDAPCWAHSFWHHLSLIGTFLPKHLSGYTPVCTFLLLSWTCHTHFHW